MYRHSLLKWTLITSLAVLITLSFASLYNKDTAEAARKQEPDGGSLRALDKDGKLTGECPLKHTSVKAEISGFLSRVTVTQEFQNPFPEKIEAVYTFPLPQLAAVDDLTMRIGDRTIKGKILEKKEAQAAYSTAKSLGQVASLLEQERPNIFIQSLANIQPGQNIEITISYVETLKYEDGSYEWVFPMVVGTRYVPNQDEIAESVSRINPVIAPKGMRSGHDVSLEVAIDAGVSLAQLKSETHETEVERSSRSRALVRLKDRDVIPNKDFVLKYQVAGDSIADAVLAHRSNDDGFFTLILQPPQRVAAADVMPKELVFVLDTSGSMSGFPIEKAKETILLALDNLYPHDTFNLITFAGDTRILFSEPVAATPENLRKAKDLLNNTRSDGGTEMMKAIKAALEPSDSQQHIRITCFLTDGQVGNDFSIISEVQKHPNARVFSMGFGNAPNRFLLDKMAEIGRGEVDYITETGDTTEVARRFNDRIRSPLLTDITIDWSSLPVSEIYPKRIPDLFGAQPVILSGRYARGGKGIIHLNGKMAGQEFVREIPVELPETEPDHDVLAKLWARRRVDDLMNRDMQGMQTGNMQPDLREEITKLGLSFKLLTQFTSFLAIDDQIMTPGGEPLRVDVASQEILNTSSSELVTVSSSAQTSTCGSFAIRSIQELPLQGRTLSSLTALTPGTTRGRASSYDSASSVNGQRASSNDFLIDGLSGNFGIAAGGESPGASAAGTSPPRTASGGEDTISTLATSAGVTVNTSYIAPEAGRGPEISVSTKAGTNYYHGSLFHFFGNDALDASDWFANSRGLNQPLRRLNNFGGTLGGYLKKDTIFFFGSYEGLRLRQPMTALSEVPSIESRLLAPATVRPFLDAFPIPNGNVRSDRFAEFAASFANPARHDLGSIRVDTAINSNNRFAIRYGFANSEASQRGAGGFSLNTINTIKSLSQSFAGSFDRVLSPTKVFTLRAGYSRSSVSGAYSFGAGVPDRSFTFDLNARDGRLRSAEDATSVQRQLNVAGSLVMISGTHDIKFGGDYRRLSPIIGLHGIEESGLFNGVEQALTGIAGRQSLFQRPTRQLPVFHNFSLYIQDEWRRSTDFTLLYGVRWDVNPAPEIRDQNAFAVEQINDLLQLSFASKSPLWKTTYSNFAPRFGVAYQLSEARQLLLRGGVGVLYDLGQERAGEAFADSIPFLSGGSIFNAPFPTGSIPSSTPVVLPLSVFDPHLKLPYVLRWNVSLEKALGSAQTVSAAYVGSAGHRLLTTETLFDANPTYEFIRLVANKGRSNYQSLQVQFNRNRGKNLATVVSYTWSKSLDNNSLDSATNVLLTSPNLIQDRGRSDFDVRHMLAGYVSYHVPAPFQSGLGNTLSRNWAIDSILTARSGAPVNVVYGVPTSVGFAYLRPNLLNGVPLYLSDPSMPGGRRINPAAFALPSGLEQGTLGRNSLEGFPLTQLDVALRRKFSFTDSVALQLQLDAFNLLNHPNFEDPLGIDLSLGSRFDPAGTLRPNLTFGQSASLSGRSTLNGEGFGSFYSFGGSRTLRLSAKLSF